MSRVFLLTHYTPHATEMSAARNEEDSSTTRAETNNSEHYEVEVFKSQIVTVASCGLREAIENIRYKSCGDPTVVVEANNGATSSPLPEETDSKKTVAIPSSAEHKTRRFKRISLPQWLLKPSRKSSHNSSRIRRITGPGGKHRILRINSAPKTLGPSGNGFAHYGDDDKFHIFQKGSSKDRGHQHSLSDLKPVKETRKIRRISLPAHVLEGGSQTVETSLPRTPEPTRRNIFDEIDEKFIHSLRIDDPRVANKTLSKPGASGKEKVESPSHENNNKAASVDHEGKLSSPRGTREGSLQFKNVRKESSGSVIFKPSRPVLKLHKFHNPDIFYVPLPEDDSQNLDPLPHKLCRARLIEPKNENYMIQECVRDELQAFLHDKQFCSRSCQQWCLELSQNIKTCVHKMKDCESKIACVVYIGALRGHGIHAATQCIWVPNEDNFITVKFKNRSMMAIASVLAIKYE
ncbi:uncharacterized protein LOC111338093 [Stylophora pistillata]|nr:uncharacterized protein LOC111338093 [Stylophora pistillata]